MALQVIYLPEDQRNKSIGRGIQAAGNAFAEVKQKQEQDAKTSAMRQLFANLLPDGSPEKQALLNPDNKMQPNEVSNLVNSLAQLRNAQHSGSKNGYTKVDARDEKGNVFPMQINKSELSPEMYATTRDNLAKKGIKILDPNQKDYKPSEGDKKVTNIYQQWKSDPGLKGIKPSEVRRRARTLSQSNAHIDDRLSKAFGKQYGDKFDFEGNDGKRFAFASKSVRDNIMVKGMKPEDAINSAIDEAKNQIQDTVVQDTSPANNNSNWMDQAKSWFTGSDNNQQHQDQSTTPVADTSNKDNKDMIDVAPVDGKMIQIPKTLTQNANRTDIKKYLTDTAKLTPEQADQFIKDNFQ